MSKLGLSGGGGTYIRFMPSVNSWQIGGDEVALRQFALDFSSIKTGWGKMSEGEAPDWVWDEQLGVRGKQPTPDHKRGFAMNLYIKEIGVVEWSSTGTGPVMGLEALYDDLETALEGAEDGSIPIVEYTGSDAKKIGKGNTRVPKFKVIKLVKPGTIDFSADGDEEEEEAKPPPKKEPPKKAPAKVESRVEDEF